MLEVNITETWGDLFYVGMTGLEILDDNNQPLPINMGNVTANPKDMN